MDLDMMRDILREKRVKWDRRYLALASQVAEWSKDPSTKVGAVIVSPDNMVVSLGYNGFPRGVNDDPARYLDRPEKYKRVVHAEANAILSAERGPHGCTLYSSLLTCNECAKLVIQSGIRRVVAPKPDITRWSNAHEVALEMYQEAGVEVTLYE